MFRVQGLRKEKDTPTPKQQVNRARARGAGGSRAPWEEQSRTVSQQCHQAESVAWGVNAFPAASERARAEGGVRAGREPEARERAAGLPVQLGEELCARVQEQRRAFGGRLLHRLKNRHIIQHLPAAVAPTSPHPHKAEGVRGRAEKQAPRAQVLRSRGEAATPCGGCRGRTEPAGDHEHPARPKTRRSRSPGRKVTGRQQRPAQQRNGPGKLLQALSGPAQPTQEAKPGPASRWSGK